MKKTTKCRYCGAEIVFLKTPRFKKLMPISASSLTTEDRELMGRGLEVLFRYGEHIPHFSDCDKPELFRK